ncbi:MAG: metallophosphoesterase [Clostridia bacterium]|nr:metallophosphoesterase [Clostridia bacterium]
MKRINKIKRALLVICILLALICSEIVYSNFIVVISRYTVRSNKAAGGIRVVFIADLHGREFGADNSRLIKRIAEEEPDLIALVGDIIDSDADDEQIGRMCAFISAAADIAPVYFGMGNHEYTYIKAHGAALAERIEEAGATVLECGYLDMEINGTPVRIGGYGGYYRTPHMNRDDREREAEDMRFFEDFEDTDRFKLLLNHIPTNWLDWDYDDKTPVDLVLCGHYHGGIVRIPIAEKGLYAPYVGWFPPYTKGCFEGKTATCVLTTGMASANGIPRFFNPPEIVVVDICPE